MLVSKRTDFEHLQMSIATLIILILLLAIIVGITIVVKMALSKLTPNNVSSASNTPTSGSTTSSTASSGGSSSGKNPSGTWSIIPLVIAGLWLGAKIILFGGEINNVEIFVIAILSILAWGFDQKKWFISLVILVILGIKFLTPSEMEHIVINRDGIYELPNRPLKVCFIKTGDPNINFYIDQQIKIDNWYSNMQRLNDCLNIPKYLSGKTVNISLLNAIRQYTPEIKRKWGFGDDINNDYEYYMKVGFGGYPTIQAR